MSATKGNERNINGRVPQMITHVDPFFYQSLQPFLNKNIVVQTIKDTVVGTLKQATPDHIVVVKEGYSFYVRIQQIIWVKPS